MKGSLRLDVLPEIQMKLFEDLSSRQFIKDFYLAGGTCLALQIGHRQSIDFDFFIPADFNTATVIKELTQFGNYKRENEEKNTINGSLNEVRISFFGYPYKIIDKYIIYRNIRLAGMKDIAAMKLEAIAGRGSKKDFIDLYFLCNYFSLDDIFSFHAQKYGSGLSNQYHLLKSLVYFIDAEEEPLPFMLENVDWGMVKSRIISQVKKLQLR